MSDKSSVSFVVGQLAGVFGVKGWVKVRSFTQPEQNILDYGPWRLRTSSGIRAVEVDGYNLRPQGLVVHFKGIDDRDVAALLGRAEIEVDKTELPELPEGEYYWHQLIGLKVVAKTTETELLLGSIAEMMETGANDVMVVRPIEGSLDDRERLIPYVPGVYVVGVNLSSGEIHVEWDSEF
jgi:16S rRNA processing protein RimM